MPLLNTELAQYLRLHHHFDGAYLCIRRLRIGAGSWGSPARYRTGQRKIFQATTLRRWMVAQHSDVISYAHRARAMGSEFRGEALGLVQGSSFRAVFGR